VVQAFRLFCDKAAINAELVIVFDGDTPTVTEEAKSYITGQIPLAVLMGYPVNMGKGFAIRQGMARATGDLLIYTDIDFPYKLESLMAVYNELKSGATDIAVGVKDNNYYAHVPEARKVISRFLRFTVRLLLSMPITDTQCGLKGFNRAVLPVFLGTTINRYLFDLEFLKICYRQKKFRIKPVEVSLNDNIQFTKMNYRVLLPEVINFVKVIITG